MQSVLTKFGANRNGGTNSPPGSGMKPGDRMKYKPSFEHKKAGENRTFDVGTKKFKTSPEPEEVNY